VAVLTAELACVAQIMFVLFTVVTVLWTTVVLRARPNSHRIHYLMIVLCVFKALTLLSQAGMYHLIRAIGHAEGWSVAFYLFTFIRGVLFFTVRWSSHIEGSCQGKGRRSVTLRGCV